MKVLNFESFLLLEDNQGFVNAEIIGDSSVGLYKSLVPNLKATYPELNKVGLNSLQLLSSLKEFTKTDPNVGIVFVAMGSNDLYIAGSRLKNIVSAIKSELSRIFPNAKLMVVKGGWGWGGLSKFQSENEPDEMKEYYDVWSSEGFDVMDKSQGFSEEHHTIKNSGIRKQAIDIASIISGEKDLYKVSQTLGDKEPSKEDLDEFYNALKNAANERVLLKQQSSGEYVFDPLVQRIQIGLEFLGKDLPRFGADGLYGPETASSIEDFKRENGIEGSGETFGPDDFIALISNLENKELDYADLGKSWKKSSDLASGLDFTGDQDYLYYMQHQQGAAGAASLLKASQGAGKLNPSTRANSGKYLTGNMPDKDISYQISAAIDAGNDQRAATLFLSYWKNFWNKKKKKALELINLPEYSQIKNAIDSVETDIPKDFLYTTAFIESGLKPKPKTFGSYKGLFAITDRALKKHVPQGDIFNPADNAYAAIKDMEQGISTFSNLAGNYLKNSGASRFMA
jgi:peptidoglycan hydrolase-like protein with peptidoglycan-binding domain